MNTKNSYFTLVLQVILSLACLTSARATDLPSGVAKGTCAQAGAAPATLTFAGAFVDQKDADKPTLLIVSDIKLPTGSWKSEFDIMRAKPPFSGAIFFLDKEGAVFRTDFYWKGRQASVAGYFKVKLDGPAGKELSGVVASNEGSTDGPKMDATFHASVK